MLGAIDRVDDLADGRGRRIARRGVNGGWVAQQLLGEAPDAGLERGAEEQALPSCREERKDAPDVMDEAHVQHAVGFVEHEDLDTAEVHGALPHMIEQPARCGHHDVDAVAQGAHLPIHADAAVDGGRTAGLVGAIRADALLDLERQLPGGHHDQRADHAGPGGTAGVQSLQHGQDEGGGLAGARLGTSEQIAPFEDEGDGLDLDGRGLAVALVGHGTEGLGRQPKGIEGQGDS